MVFPCSHLLVLCQRMALGSMRASYGLSLYPSIVIILFMSRDGFRFNFILKHKHSRAILFSDPENVCFEALSTIKLKVFVSTCII